MVNKSSQEIPYVSPPKTSVEYAEAALARLRRFERVDPRLLAYLLAPSNVLVLAGLRSMSPYNDRLHPDIDMDLFQKMLAENDLLWLDENPSLVKPELASFALINLKVADHLADSYPMELLRRIGPVFEHSGWGFYAWISGMDIAIARAIEHGTLPEEWLQDWWAPHDIRFGMLLGYPGPALSSLAWAELHEENVFGIEFIEVSSGLYESAAVGFLIDKERGSDPRVLAMLEIWHATLAHVYDAYPEADLMKNAEFAKIVKSKE
jgi:hypothetical protein